MLTAAETDKNNPIPSRAATKFSSMLQDCERVEIIALTLRENVFER